MDALTNAARKYANPQIDWEQRRYEIAKEMLPYTTEINRNWLNGTGDDVSPFAAKDAVAAADALINELKKKKP